MRKDNLTLKFMSYSEIHKLESIARIKKILDNVLERKIVILQGRLEPSEEASLIQSTMALIGRVKDFKGIEIAVISPEAEDDFMTKIKIVIARRLVGARDALTIIGPGSIVKEIKKDPKKIELLLKR